MGSSKGLLQEMVAGGAAGGLLGPQPAKVFSRLVSAQLHGFLSRFAHIHLIYNRRSRLPQIHSSECL